MRVLLVGLIMLVSFNTIAQEKKHKAKPLFVAGATCVIIGSGLNYLSTVGKKPTNQIDLIQYEHNQRTTKQIVSGCFFAAGALTLIGITITF